MGVPIALDDVRSTTGWRVLTSVVYSGVIAAALIVAAALILGVKPSAPAISTVGALQVGDCVTVADDGPTPVACGEPAGAAVAFTVAETQAANTACSAPNYARVDTEGATLCVVPKLVLDTCYRVAPDSAATTDIAAVACPTALGGDTTNVVKVTQRAVGGPLTCPTSAALNYSSPQQIGYCIAPAV